MTTTPQESEPVAGEPIRFEWDPPGVWSCKNYPCPYRNPDLFASRDESIQHHFDCELRPCDCLLHWRIYPQVTQNECNAHKAAVKAQEAILEAAAKAKDEAKERRLIFVRELGPDDPMKDDDTTTESAKEEEQPTEVETLEIPGPKSKRRKEPKTPSTGKPWLDALFQKTSRRPAKKR